MELRQQLAILRSWWKVIVFGTILAAGVAYFVSNLLPKTFQSEARLLVGQHLQASTANPAAFQTSIMLADTYAELATDWPVLERVKERLGLDTPIISMRGYYRVEAATQQPFVEILAVDGTPEGAAALANTLAEALVEMGPSVSGEDPRYVREDLEATRAQIDDARTERDALAARPNRTPAQQDRLDELEIRLAQLRGTYAALLESQGTANPNTLSVVSPALVPTGQASPRPLFNAGVAGALALLVTLAIAFGVERFDDRLKSAEDVERVTGLPTIGQIVRMPGDGDRDIHTRLAALLHPRSTAAEAFRGIRTNIEFASVDTGIRSLVVTSAHAGEGKSVVAANLALVFAQGGRRTLLVDADMRRPSVHRLFQLPNDAGLTTLLVSDEEIDEVAQPTEEENLRVISTGPLPPNPAELLNSHRMESVLERLKRSADLVIFDSPPVGAVTDAAVLSVRTDGTLLVIRASSTHEPAVRRAVGALEAVGGRILGVVLNALSADAHHQTYYGPYDADPTGGRGTGRRTATATSGGATVARSTRSASSGEPTP